MATSGSRSRGKSPAPAALVTNSAAICNVAGYELRLRACVRSAACVAMRPQCVRVSPASATSATTGVAGMRAGSGSASAIFSTSSIVDTRCSVERVEDVLRDVGQVLLVVARQDDVLDAGAVRRQHLLLHAADRQHLAAQRDLAGHRHVAADRNPGQRRDERGGHRDAGRRAVLRDRALGHVDVDVDASSGSPSARPSSAAFERT